MLGCPALAVEEGYVEPHHGLLPGNMAAVYRENYKILEATCQADGKYSLISFESVEETLAK